MNLDAAQMFEGKVVLVTGAARGQGRAHAVRFAELGADVIAVDIGEREVDAPYAMGSPEELEETGRLVEAAGRRAVVTQADVRSLAELEAAVRRGRERLGEIDVVCANAGITTFGAGIELGEEAWTEMIDINLNGVWRTIRAAAPAMVAAGNGGSIVITASTAALRPFANLAHYTAAKHGLIGLAKVLAAELAADAIRVNVVCPGTVRTPMMENETAARLFRPDLEDPTVEDMDGVLRGMNPMGEPWVPIEDITAAVVWLASPAARYVTGTAVPVDMGALVG